MVVKTLSRVQLFVTPSTVAHQAPPSMGFSRHDYWSRLPFPSPGNLSDPGIKPASPTLAGRFSPTVPPWEAPLKYCKIYQNATHRYEVRKCNWKTGADRLG